MSDIIDINISPVIETVSLTIQPNLTTINVNTVTGGGGAVDSVNGETGIVVLNQDEILDGTTYKQYSLTEKNKLAGIEAGAEVNVNADWNAVSGDAQILNKPTIPDVSNLVPYTGATTNVNLGTHSITAKDLIVTHSSGSGDAATITKGGNGEALKVEKTSGSGNAASITGGVTLLDELHLNTDLADSYIASASVWNAKQDTLPAASTSVDGYLTSTDWNTFNQKCYAINIGATSTTYVANSTYYFGIPTQNATASVPHRKIFIPKTGTIKGGQIYIRTTTSTTSENWTLSIRLNNTTNTTFATVGTIGNEKIFGTTSLNIAVVAGDFIEITTTTPAWVTGPGSSFIYGTIIIQ